MSPNQVGYWSIPPKSPIHSISLVPMTWREGRLGQMFGDGKSRSLRVGVRVWGLDNREVHGWLGLVDCMYARPFFFLNLFSHL